MFIDAASSALHAALRVAAVVIMMTGPVFAVTAMKADNGGRISGAGLVLFVSLERA